MNTLLLALALLSPSVDPNIQMRGVTGSSVFRGPDQYALRLRYDASNYADLTSTSGGDLTITPSGGDVSVVAHLAPSADSTYTIGTSSAYWDVAYLDRIEMPTTSSTEGQLVINGTAHYHAYGTKNAFIGEGAGNFTTTSTNNTGIGYQALASVTTGNNNLGLGANALDALTEAFRCVAIGQNAGGAVTTGNDNTLVGYQAGLNITTGQYNTILGAQAGLALTTQDQNCIIGRRAGQNLTGASNIFIGYLAGNTLTTEDNIFLVGVGTSSRFLWGEIDNDNLALGTDSGFGTSATNTFALTNGTAPSTSPADVAQIYVNDASGAGTASLHVRNEEGHIFIFREQSTTGTTTGFTAGSGTSANDDSTFTGNTGSTAYTIGDIVFALKTVGILAD